MARTLIPDMLGRRRLARFERAVEAYAFKGAGHPEDIPAVEAEYARAKHLLLRHLDDQALVILDLVERSR